MNDRSSALKWLIIPAILVVLYLARNSTDKPAPGENGDEPQPTPTAISPSGKNASGGKSASGGKDASGGVTKLKIEDLKVGSGAVATTGDNVTMHYRGTLMDGTVFDESYKRGEPFPFRLGAGEVIKGWDEGIKGMKVGGKRRLTIPSDMAYGPAGRPPTIPPSATLKFDVELLKVN